MNLGHSFDLKGFTFAGKIFIASIAVGIIGHIGVWYVTGLSPTTSASPVLIAVQDIPTTIAQASTANFSTTTSQRIINKLTVADAVPQEGKFITADLEQMRITLYQDGAVVGEYSILTKGRPGSPFETPAGFYNVLIKESNHFNNLAQVYLPYAIQFYGNYFIHGWPYYTDGTPVSSSYSGGCIRLSVADAEKVFAFSDKSTGIFVHDPVHTSTLSSLVLDTVPTPIVSAAAYLVADIDTGDVFLEKEAQDTRPIASVTKLMTALVANETIMYNRSVSVTRGELLHTEDALSTKKEMFVVGDMFYPLLMESNNAVANRLAQYIGTTTFIDWMNTTATALDMKSTHFADASGISAENVSNPDDLYRLTTYITNKKSFIWDITKTPTKQLTATSGNTYYFKNFNVLFRSSDFLGGKVGQTNAARETMASVFSISVSGVPRRVAIIVLESDNNTDDTKKLADWFTQSALQGMSFTGTACISCTKPANYRKIQ